MLQVKIFKERLLRSQKTCFCISFTETGYYLHRVIKDITTKFHKYKLVNVFFDFINREKLLHITHSFYQVYLFKCKLYLL